jgi:SAM-dependent methyltransferase
MSAAVDPMGIGVTASDDVSPRFVARLQAIEAPHVLELGTRRWSDTPTHHQAWAPDAATYVMSDVEEGVDVDVVADAHDLAPFDDASLDAVIAASVWEHLARPWVAARAAARVLRPGGLLYVATHHCFPVHGYPSDFTRWTTAGLAVLFEDAGLETIAAGYGYPCTIVPPPEVTRWNPAAPAYLNVAGVWSKPC